MSVPVTLGAMRTAARQRAGMENVQFVTDPEANYYINESIADFYDFLLECKGREYFQKSGSITTVQGQELYNLPSDFYQLIMVEIIAAGVAVPMVPYQKLDHGRLSQAPTQGGRIVTLYYAPVAPQLVVDGDTLDSVDRWDTYVVVQAAKKMLDKQEQESGHLAAELMAIQDKVQRQMPDRDAGMPDRIQDATRKPYLPFVFEPIPRYRLVGQQISILQGLLPVWVWE